jgi:hypothetical protein
MIVARNYLVNNGASRSRGAGIRGNDGDYESIVRYCVKDRVLTVLLALLDAYKCNDHSDNKSDATDSSSNDDADRDAG